MKQERVRYYQLFQAVCSYRYVLGWECCWSVAPSLYDSIVTESEHSTLPTSTPIQLHLLAVGGRPDNSVYNFRGTIADLLVTNVALPYDVIQSMSSASLTGQFQPSTVSRYCFMQAETGKYCHANSRADNNFKWAFRILHPPLYCLEDLHMCTLKHYYVNIIVDSLVLCHDLDYA